MREAPVYDPANIFARIIRGDLPSHKVFEDAHSLAIMDVMPQGPGHILVIPKHGSRNLLDAAPETLGPVMATVQKMAQAAKAAFEADGITVLQFNEAAGGQSVFHLHFHVIPRFDGIGLTPHSGPMEKPDVLAAMAERLRTALADLDAVHS